MRNWNDDPYTKKARKENFAARSAYKLEEIHKKYGVLKGAKTVLDLGASPGSWSQFCLKQNPNMKIIAVDIKPLEIEAPQIRFLHQDIETVEWKHILSGDPCDVVLSDMAPNTSGLAAKDCALSYDLATLALDTAKTTLKEGGNFVVKFFMGEDFEEFRDELRAHFGKVQQFRPKSTRKQSREIFFVGLGYKP